MYPTADVDVGNVFRVEVQKHLINCVYVLFKSQLLRNEVFGYNAVPVVSLKILDEVGRIMLQIFILSPKLLLRNLATSMLQVTLSSLQALLYRSAFFPLVLILSVSPQIPALTIH